MAVAKSVSRAQLVGCIRDRPPLLANSREADESECIYVTFASRSGPPDRSGCSRAANFLQARRRFGSSHRPTAAAAKTRARTTAVVATGAAAWSATAKFHFDPEYSEISFN